MPTPLNPPPPTEYEVRLTNGHNSLETLSSTRVSADRFEVVDGTALFHLDSRPASRTDSLEPIYTDPHLPAFMQITRSTTTAFAPGRWVSVAPIPTHDPAPSPIIHAQPVSDAENIDISKLASRVMGRMATRSTRSTSAEQITRSYPPPPASWTPGSGGNAKRTGWEAYYIGRGREDCPFPPNRLDLKRDYQQGWDAARRHDKTEGPD